MRLSSSSRPMTLISCTSRFTKTTTSETTAYGTSGKLKGPPWFGTSAALLTSIPGSTSASRRRCTNLILLFLVLFLFLSASCTTEDEEEDGGVPLVATQLLCAESLTLIRQAKACASLSR